MSVSTNNPTRFPRATATGDLLAWLILTLRSVEREAVERCLERSPIEMWEQAGGGRIEGECVPSDSNDPSALVERLRTEYVRLFLQNREQPPAHLEALAYQQDLGPAAQTSRLELIRAHSLSLGVDIEAGSPYPIDHLTILLELIYLDPPEGVAALAEHPIWAECVAPWLGEFLRRLRDLKPHPYYGCAMRVLRAIYEFTATDETNGRT